MSNADWWSKQLGSQPNTQQQRPVDLPVAPSQQPMTRFEPPVPQQLSITTLSLFTSAKSTNNSVICFGVKTIPKPPSPLAYLKNSL